MSIVIGGKYILGKAIGEGAFGEIYDGTGYSITTEGICEEDGQRVAIKLVSRLKPNKLGIVRRKIPATRSRGHYLQANPRPRYTLTPKLIV